MNNLLAGLALTLAVGSIGFEAAAQETETPIKTAVLESRRVDKDTGVDNYEYATFSFLHGVNGPSGKEITRNDWDVKFSTRVSAGRIVDYFDVTMVVDDRSRIVDLGELAWDSQLKLPDLPAFEKPTREKPVEAKVGHIYYVHTADRDSDHYALFRVEGIESGQTVLISWKLIGVPAEGSK